MRYESCVTSLSWIPSEAVTGTTRAFFDAGFTHYDEPPPAVLGDIEELRAAHRFRFANLLRAWIDVDGSGRITAGGYGGGGLMGATTVRLGSLNHTFQAVALPDLQREPERGRAQSGGGASRARGRGKQSAAAGKAERSEEWMRFVQTAGGRTALPMPRPVRHPPFVQWQAPLVWTTLSLTLHADGHAEYEVAGASRFPRHWIYDAAGELAHKSGLTDYANWAGVSFGRRTPWGDEDSPALVTAVESALERTLSVQLMHGGAKPRISQLDAGTQLVRQGEPGREIYLVLDGVIRVERDGTRLAEYGPGAILGERAGLEGGVRTSTLVAATTCRVASVDVGQFDSAMLTELAAGHQREDPASPAPALRASPRTASPAPALRASPNTASPAPALRADQRSAAG
jgi:Cyclic nucleotide-binding domain